MSFQEEFVDFLKTSVPKHISLAEEIADLLSISKDSSYRRLRNDTPFTLEESMMVCDHFNIDASGLFSRSDTSIRFDYNKLYNSKEGFLNYILQFIPLMKEVGTKGGKITYASEDIPFFHHFAHPDLAAFKIFYWLKAVLNSKEYADLKFKKEYIDPDLLAAVKEFNQGYRSAESTEIWTDESVLATLKQIVYYVESGQFEDKTQANSILDGFEVVMAEIKSMAEKSSKLPNAEQKNFNMYYSEVQISNNCILLELEQHKHVYLSHNTFNSLHTQDPSFVHETENWLENMLKKATPISGTAEKHRFQFFEKVSKAIVQCRERINA